MQKGEKSFAFALHHLSGLLYKIVIRKVLVRRELSEYGDYNDFALVLQPANFDACVTRVYKQASLQEIYGEFGQSALDFTGELYEQGLVALMRGKTDL